MAHAQMYSYGMMGPGWFRHQSNFNISSASAKSHFERWIAIQGNSRLKVGEVPAKDIGTIAVDNVTRDNSLVQRFLVHRHAGFYLPERS
jgi:hypothetical protein